MTVNALDTIRFILAWGWRFFTGYYIPGTNVTPGAILFFIVFVKVTISFIKRLSDVSSSGSKREEG